MASSNPNIPNPLATPNDMLRLINKETGSVLLVAKPAKDAPVDPRTGFREPDPLNEERKATLEALFDKGYRPFGEKEEDSFVRAGSIQPKDEPLSSDKVTLTLADIHNMIAIESTKAVQAALEGERAKQAAKDAKPAKSEKASA